ncbi:MAG: OsmC family peroxiredoxin [Candidatus Omnitrophota bacterium]|jgi:uncharacterized OsmC-like protein|nr:MAG: OsmC family peroxiredoxin [Candidatus Omnitrophota bacterium]
MSIAYKVEISSEKDYFRAKSKDYEFEIGTKGRGMSPPDVLLASVASCVGVYIRKYFESAKAGECNFLVRAEADFAKEPPFRFDEIKIDIELKGLKLDDRRKSALLEFVKNCPVHNTLKCNPKVNININ